MVRGGVNGDWQAALVWLARHGDESWRTTERHEVADITLRGRDMTAEEIRGSWMRGNGGVKWLRSAARWSPT